MHTQTRRSRGDRGVAGCALASLLALSLMTAQASAGELPVDYQTIDFSDQFNARLQTINPALPSGSVQFDDVPFDIPSNGNNYWSANAAGGPNPRMIDIPVDLPSPVSAVHTLINTLWGRPLDPTLLRIEFFGSDGAHFVKNLIGDDDVRDLVERNYTNQINNTTTVNVFTLDRSGAPDLRIDKQFIELPAEFQTQMLTRIVLVDNGASELSRGILMGATAQLVPEPSAVGLLVAGGALLTLARRRR